MLGWLGKMQEMLWVQDDTWQDCTKFETIKILSIVDKIEYNYYKWIFCSNRNIFEIIFKFFNGIKIKQTISFSFYEFLYRFSFLCSMFNEFETWKEYIRSNMNTRLTACNTFKPAIPNARDCKQKWNELWLHTLTIAFRKLALRPNMFHRTAFAF